MCLREDRYLLPIIVLCIYATNWQHPCSAIDPMNPNILRRSRQVLLTIGALVISLAGATQLWSQSVGLQTQYRLVSTSAQKEVRVDTGFVANASAPQSYSGTNYGVLGGSVTDSSIQVSTDYGDMTISGSGFASNSPTNGCFAFIDTAFGGAPFSMYQDVLNVTSSTLAKGTAVTIDFTESFATSYAGFNPSYFADNLRISDSKALDNWNLTLTSTGSANFEFHTAVGDSLYLEGDLHGGGAAYANSLSPPFVSESFSFSESGPLYITSVTDGVDIQSESGATYSAPAASVPDSSETSLLVGISLLAIASFRRRYARS